LIPQAGTFVSPSSREPEQERQSSHSLCTPATVKTFDTAPDSQAEIVDQFAEAAQSM
jgi:hypothetical protein